MNTTFKLESSVPVVQRPSRAILASEVSLEPDWEKAEKSLAEAAVKIRAESKSRASANEERVIHGND